MEETNSITIVPDDLTIEKSLYFYFLIKAAVATNTIINEYLIILIMPSSKM